MTMDTPKTEQALQEDNEQAADERSDSKTSGSSAPENADASGSKKSEPARKSSSVKSQPLRTKNNVRKLRMDRMMSKAELARRASLSTLTIDRVEKGMPCRMDTKRKILEALGLTPSDRVAVFGEDD